jgi:sulfide:quinone oxidoreductase
MSVLGAISSLQAVVMRPNSRSERPVRVVVAGGGAAGLEALIGLRSLAGDQIELELISPERTYAPRSVTRAAGFASGPEARIEIAELTEAIGAECTSDALTAVQPSVGMLTLASNANRSYDVLLVATGTQPEVAIPGAISFGAPHETERFRKMLAQAEAGALSRLVFAVPEGAGWPLALYELALLTAARLRAASVAVEITLLSPESAPLAVFGGRASAAALEELQQFGIDFVGGLEPQEIAWGELRANPGKARIQADAVVTLPRLRGPATEGLPCDQRGFIQVDARGLVPGTSNVYAAGDAAAFPIKDGRLATQQAGTVAVAIAARLDANEASTASPRPLSRPRPRVVGRYLASYLSRHVTVLPSSPSGILAKLEIDPEIGSARAASALC